MKDEIWKSVKGYENYYEISNYGNFRSLDRKIIRSDGIIQLRKGQMITPVANQDGYLQVKLCRDGKYRAVRIHRLVAEAFIPNPNNLPEINHKDCNRKNNHVDNLEWINHIDNVQYSSNQEKYIHTGESNPNFGNKKLKEYYAKYPEEAKRVLSRPGSQNGRSKSVRMYKDNNCIKEFSYIGECAKYMIEQNITKSKSINSIRDHISIAAHTNTPYYSYYFEFID